MNRDTFVIDKNLSKFKTPYYVVCEDLLEQNLKKIESVIKSTNCKILLAQKGFSTFATYPLLSKFLSGTTASSLHEAKLGKEEFGKETHIFAPAFRDDEIDEILQICDHIVFNSFNQWQKFRSKVMQKNLERVAENIPTIECGIRINPEYAEIEHDIYNPCFSGSRLGVTLKNFKPELLDGISGLHFHTMCEQNSDVLQRTIKIVDEKFGKYLKGLKWINFGGGHHITKQDYDVSTLIDCINFFKNKYDIQVYLEPGEAVALDCGFLVSEVMDIVENEIDIAILDTSAACHMPDVLEMPYRPRVVGSGEPNEKQFMFRLGTPTCLAGDIIGDYSFDKPLKIGDKLIFCDMAIYSMVKNNTFNGIKLPSIIIKKLDGSYVLQKEFGYQDFKNRLS